jgi:hypothetical protein
MNLREEDKCEMMTAREDGEREAATHAEGKRIWADGNQQVAVSSRNENDASIVSKCIWI